MPSHVKLPSNDGEPTKPKPKFKLPSNPDARDKNAATKPVKHSSAADLMSDRVTLDIPAGHRVYMAQLRLRGSSLKAILWLSHTTKYEDSIFNDMVREAAKICEDSRIKNRRQEMADQKTPIDDPVRINEDLFAGDVSFVEVVMCDKWGFKKLFVSAGEGEIAATINIPS